ncbi:MAG: glycosyltransferase [Myxococcota bacterium]
MARIPRLFHFVWLRPAREPLPLPWYLALESCFAVNRPEKVSVYVLEEPVGELWERLRPRLDVVRAELAPEVERVPDDSPLKRFRWAHHADFVRLDKLFAHGGVYADLDTLFVHPIPDALFEQSFVIGHEAPVGDPPQPSLSNCLMLAEPGAPFIALWRAQMGGAFDGASWTAHSCELVTRLAAEHPDLVHVEPMRTFSAVEHTIDGVRRLVTGLDPDLARGLPGVASVHLCAHTWWDWDVVWRTSFFGALLTPDFIRAVDTTYTVLARPYLPPGPMPSPAKIQALRALLAAVHATDRLLDWTSPRRGEILARVRPALLPIVRPLVRALRRVRARG